jgi:hypothetical protein
VPPAITAFMPAGAGAGVAPVKATAMARAAAVAATMEAVAAAVDTMGAAVGGARAADGAGRVDVAVVAAAAAVCRAKRWRMEALRPLCSHHHYKHTGPGATHAARCELLMPPCFR